MVAIIKCPHLLGLADNQMVKTKTPRLGFLGLRVGGKLHIPIFSFTNTLIITAF